MGNLRVTTTTTSTTTTTTSTTTKRGRYSRRRLPPFNQTINNRKIKPAKSQYPKSYILHEISGYLRIMNKKIKTNKIILNIYPRLENK
jgi:hypothetical protein